MHWSRRELFASLAAGAARWPIEATAARSSPFGAVPTERQLRWQRMETCAFLHFTVNTFTGREWGLGDEDPSIFAPTDFDADAVNKRPEGRRHEGRDPHVQAPRRLLPVAHEDDRSLHRAQQVDGTARAMWCARSRMRRTSGRGLKFGVYVSPWDRNNAAYGTPAYLPIYRAQITELLSNYGPIFEVWFDGANGGDGFYGGAREKRTIDKLHYYGWPETWALVRKLQPDAVIFSDSRPGPAMGWQRARPGRRKLLGHHYTAGRARRRCLSRRREHKD